MPEPVKIRSLTPLVRIRMPTDSHKHRPTQVKVVRRTQVSHPSPTPQPTPCRLWQGAAGSDGYGWRKVGEGAKRKGMSMHRWVMSEYLGRPLKPTEVVLHACDQPFCYRIDHLSLGTVADNNADMAAKGRNTPPPVNVFHGECHPMAKLTANQVRAIRGHYQSGLYIKTIASMFEVSPSTIRRIVREQRWQQLGDDVRGGHSIIRPPTKAEQAAAKAARKEAEEKARSERSALAAADGGAPSAAPWAERIRPVKHLTLTRRNDDDDDR